MEWLNYHHLLYFWVVAREGSLGKAGEVLRLSHPTLSAQVRALEERLGEKLFTRTARRMELTEAGRTVFRYADEIFTLGREMLDVLKGEGSGEPLRLRVGIVDVVPKMVVGEVLQPLLALEEPVRLVCHEAPFDKLLADLAAHSLDIVISDAPVPPGSSVKAFHHLLGETDVTFFGNKTLAAHYKRGFPQSLDGAPLLMPMEGLALRRSLNAWFARIGVRPRTVAEFEDSALLKVFGRQGVGIFPAPTVIADEVCRQHDVQVVGRSEAVKERFYAVSVERRLKNPAVVALLEAARHEMFA